MILLHCPKNLLRRRTGLVVLTLLLPLAVTTGGHLGYRLNLTPSAPMGIWRLRTLDRPIVAGDLVFVCPPQTQAIEEARARGYLRTGPCRGGYAPFIKTIAALSGQRVQVGKLVKIDDVALANSDLSFKDGDGRKLEPYGGGRVSAGNVFLYSEFRGSYDSRYFGPLPASGVLGLAEEVLTIDP